MDGGTWIPIYIPLVIILFIVVPQQLAIQSAVQSKIRKKKKGVVEMTNELIKKYIGKNCQISTGSFNNSVKGKMIDVNENWLEVETKKGSELINTEYIQSIKLI